jgi:protein-L-isoaspartate(D-aspartate) O-methyltransferase
VTKTAASSALDRAAEVRHAMTDRLRADGWIASDAVEAAFRAVPREVFMPPGTSLEDAYGAGEAVITKQAADGRNISSVSAPWLQAKMIAQAVLRPGMSVLEVGSGGCNAAILAEVTGPSGRVVSVDIDPEITARAVATLGAAGYGRRVTVVTADAEHGVPEFAPYDAIIVTAGAWDIPPAWTGQLAPGGTLVVPLRLNSVTRSIAFRRSGSHLVSTSAQVCGFVPMQGIGARPEQVVEIPHPRGGQVRLLFEDGTPDEFKVPGGVLGTSPVAAYSGITIGDQVSFADLYLWLAGLPGFCRVSAEDEALLAGNGCSTGKRRSWFPFGIVQGDSFGYLWLRPVDRSDPPLSEFSAWGYGPHALAAAVGISDAIREWDRRGRDLPGSAFAYWPDGTDAARMPAEAVVFRKAHGAATVAWPARA